MTRAPRSLALGALAAALVLAGGSARAADAEKYRLKPGATGKVCLDCHADFAEKVAQPFVHTPVKAGECSDCHDPHASDHGKLLETDPNAICARCHEDLAPADARSAHPAVVEGRCVECHDPHASGFRNVLRAEADATCRGCHADLVAAAAAARHPHVPVQRGCLGCHDPHASRTADALLERPVPDLCVSCHAPSAPEFARAHEGYPVGGSDCSGCHDPHGSSNSGLLWASVHAPLTRRMCGQCHEEPASADALALKREGPELCRGCHVDVYNETTMRRQIHWPVLDDRACANCHDPHASPSESLLSAPQAELCAGCHQDVARRHERSKVKHPPVEDGACSTCHLPHAADTTFLLAASDDIELCGTCHDWRSHSAHPMGNDVADPRNPNLVVDCLSCHRNHGTPHAYLAHQDPKQELCTRCHTELTR